MASRESSQVERLEKLVDALSSAIDLDMYYQGKSRDKFDEFIRGVYRKISHELEALIDMFLNGQNRSDHL
jgi:hypothetical protein